MAYHDDFIRFPPGTISSKLDSKLLKKPPSSIDWIHQSYMEMIQDIPYDTSHYYELPKKRTVPVVTTPTKPNATVVIDLSKIQPSTIHHHHQKPKIDATIASPIQKDIDSKEDDDDDDDSEYCNTNTTTSTDYNRKNNIYRYYKEQQSIDRPFDDDEPVFPTTTLRIITTCDSSNIVPSIIEESHNNNKDNNSSVVTREDTKIPNHQQQQYKKKLKKIGKLITKMRITAEKPFWSIDDHF